MTLIPLPPPSIPCPPREERPALTTVRLKEITPLYRPITLHCPVGAYLDGFPALRCAEDVARLFAFLEFESRETFFALHLTTKNRILCLDQVSLGSLTAAIVHPREVYSSALLSGAASVIFVHNHPSGDPTPSAEDHALHRRLRAAGDLLGIRVLDSLVVGAQGRYTSLAEWASPAEAGAAPEEEADLFI